MANRLYAKGDMTRKNSIHLGYDIGGTKTELAALDGNSQILFQKRMPTERDKGYDHILTVLKTLFQDFLIESSTQIEDLATIGIALPGSVDPTTQIMTIGNTRALEGKPLTIDLLHSLNIDIPIYAANDANCFALAECHLGVGKNNPIHNMIGVILGTGVGGGIVIDRKILTGSRGAAGEIGHIFLKDTNEICYCGQSGCAELTLSGTGLQKSYLEKTGQTQSASIILKDTDFLTQYKSNLAMFLAKLTNLFDPDCFVLGGGVSKQDVLYQDMQDLMVPYLFYKKDPPKVFKHAISDSAGSLGAALLYKL